MTTQPFYRHIFITGVSSGIGYGLARLALQRGVEVYGVSRRSPDDLAKHSGFHFQALDLERTESIAAVIQKLLENTEALDLVVLNAGRLGHFSDLREAELADLQRTMLTNVWCNKVLLDALAISGTRLKQVVAISSGASVNGNRGWSGYSVSKAALNMLVKLYASEQPGVHWSALAPGLVETKIQEELRAVPPDERFPGLEKMRRLQGTDQMPDAETAAGRLLECMQRLPTIVASGEYADVREL